MNVLSVLGDDGVVMLKQIARLLLVGVALLVRYAFIRRASTVLAIAQVKHRHILRDACFQHIRQHGFIRATACEIIIDPVLPSFTKLYLVFACLRKNFLLHRAVNLTTTRCKAIHIDLL